jgi:hypothetical protein
MKTFIDEHREVCGVEPICRVLPIAPSTYYAHARCQTDPERRSRRIRRDGVLSTHRKKAGISRPLAVDAGQGRT